MREREKKFVFVTGGVLSSLGKGLAAASMGALLEARGLRVSFLKLDPYLNVDPGTMNPFQHGEVYVTEDGAETDLDLGHYERFTSAVMGRKNNVTAGSIYEAVLEKERRGEYLGRTVQVIPHVTDEIVARIWRAAADVDLLFVEVGGTVGDIESLPFLEAIRQFRLQAGRGNVCYVHMGLVPYVATAGELKTKPVQHSVKELRAVGISPDVILCRTDRILPRAVKHKIALFCNVDEDAVIAAADVDSIYEVPLLFHEEGVDETLTRLLNIWTGRPDLERWQRLSSGARCARREVAIAMVGKYVDLTESYKSLNEALYHAGLSHEARVHIRYVDAEKLDGPEGLPEVAGVLVPHGFGGRGAEGKIVAIRYARELGIPFFGICFGMQLAVIESCRHVAGIADASSAELDPQTSSPVIDLLPAQRDVEKLGATMRLGTYPCVLVPGSRAHAAYGTERIAERHRHRYEVNPALCNTIARAGLTPSGRSPDGRLVEVIEASDHPWFLGCQFHPEFKSTPFSPHPLFHAFVAAALERAGG